MLPAENATGELHQATAFIYVTGPQRIIAAATIGAISSLAPTLGPTVGGWITDDYRWHWLFFVNLIPGIFVAVVVPILVRVGKPDLKLRRGADYPGMALMAAFLGTLGYTLEEGPRWGWLDDGTIRTTAWIAAIAGGLFIWSSLSVARPVVDLYALKRKAAFRVPLERRPLNAEPRRTQPRS